MEPWRRLRPRPSTDTGVAICAVLGVSALLAVIVAARIYDIVWIIPIGIAAVATGVIAWLVRRQYHGVFIGTDRLRIVSTAGTEMFAWASIARFEARTSSGAKLIGAPWKSLWIVTTTGLAHETDVIRGSYTKAPRWLLRPVVTLPTSVSLPPPGLYLAEPDFDAVVAELRAELAARRESASA